MTVAGEKRMCAPPQPSIRTGKDKMWYAFEYGPVFFLQYSTEHRFGPGSEQYQFMVKVRGSWFGRGRGVGSVGVYLWVCVGV